MPTLSRRDLSISLPVLLSSALVVYALFSVSAGAPLFGSDEYAYFISGKFNDRLAALHQHDPALQQIANLLYFAIIHAATQVFGSHFVDGFRLLHAIEYLLAALLVRQTVVDLIGERNAWLGTAAFLLMPTHIYIYPVLPEVELVLLASLLGWIMVRLYPRHTALASVLAGIVLGSALLIKPHALAMLLATLAAIIAAGWLRPDPGRWRRIILPVPLLLASSLLSIAVLWRLLAGVWPTDPSTVLGLGFYGRYLDPVTRTASLTGKIGSALSYLAAHWIVVALLFAPVLVWLISQPVRQRRLHNMPASQREQAQQMLALFPLAMLVTHSAMTAWFTAGAALLGDAEAMRLHGRYLGPALVLFPPLYFFALDALPRLEKKIISLVLAGALLASLGILLNWFRIFPWDHPLLFAFFNPDNWYHWTFEDPIPYLGTLLLTAILFGVCLSLLWPRLQNTILCLQLFVLLAAGCAQTYSWIYAHLRSNAELSLQSKALGTLLGGGQFGKGLVIADDRFGRQSYLLFGLANAPTVIQRPAGAVITEKDLAGADWLVLGNDYRLQFQPRTALLLGPLQFFPLRWPPALRLPAEPPAPLPDNPPGATMERNP